YSYMSFPNVKVLDGGNAAQGARFTESWRGAVRAAIRKSLPEPEASLTVGVVIGDRTSMPRALLGAFQASGTTHVLAISGENIALVTGFVLLLLRQTGLPRSSPSGLRRRPTLWLTVALMVTLALYTAFTGASPSVVRATAMSAILLFA